MKFRTKVRGTGVSVHHAKHRSPQRMPLAKVQHCAPAHAGPAMVRRLAHSPVLRCADRRVGRHERACWWRQWLLPTGPHVLRRLVVAGGRQGHVVQHAIACCHATTAYRSFCHYPLADAAAQGDSGRLCEYRRALNPRLTAQGG
jgi:hypothetical protein